MTNLKVFLMIDADTRLEFKNRAQAFIYADKNKIPSMVLTIYPDNKASVFNPYITSENCVEYFPTEQDAMKYIGGF